jgi:hypothetical protein
MTLNNGDALYAWQVQEYDGRWSMVGALIPETGTHSPLIHRELMIVRRMEGLARAHAEGTGQPLRLVKFTVTEVLEP